MKGKVVTMSCRCGRTIANEEYELMYVSQKRTTDNCPIKIVCHGCGAEYTVELQVTLAESYEPAMTEDQKPRTFGELRPAAKKLAIKIYKDPSFFGGYDRACTAVLDYYRQHGINVTIYQTRFKKLMSEVAEIVYDI